MSSLIHHSGMSSSIPSSSLSSSVQFIFPSEQEGETAFKGFTPRSARLLKELTEPLFEKAIYPSSHLQQHLYYNNDSYCTYHDTNTNAMDLLEGAEGEQINISDSEAPMSPLCQHFEDTPTLPVTAAEVVALYQVWLNLNMEVIFDKAGVLCILIG
jgi:hypothetical protein